MTIAIIRLSSLGDIILTGPAVRGLRREYSEAKLVYITTEPYRSIAERLPGVDEVIVIPKENNSEFRKALKELSEREWDGTVDLQGSPRSKKICYAIDADAEVVDTPPRFSRFLLIATKLRAGHFEPVPIRQLETLSDWEVKDDKFGLLLESHSEDIRYAQLKFPIIKKNPLVLIPGAKHNTKKWPDEYWQELALEQIQYGPILIVGQEDEVPEKLAQTALDSEEIYNIAGKTDLPTLLALFQSAKAVIAGDTGPMHMAVAAGTPTIALYGPTVEEFGFFPFRSDSTRVLQIDLFCRPCRAHGSKRCPLLHHRCLKNISPSTVSSELNRLLQRDEKILDNKN